jgi:hypothetical protein
MKRTKKDNLIGLSVLGIPVFAFVIIYTMVSLKYETDYPADCISLVTLAPAQLHHLGKW